MIKKVRIYGAGDHSQVVRDVFLLNNYTVTNILNDAPESVHHLCKQVAMGARHNLYEFPHEGEPIIITIGIDSQ